MTEAGTKAAFDQRLYVPWWGWPPPLLAAGLLAAEVHMGHPGVRSWLPYVVTIVPTVLLLWWLGRSRVRVVDDVLWVGRAHLPRRYMGEITVVDKHRKRHAMGRELDPAAFVSHRPWVGPMVRVEVDDPEDPTPYWLFSTRTPQELVRALSRSGT